MTKSDVILGAAFEADIDASPLSTRGVPVVRARSAKDIPVVVPGGRRRVPFSLVVEAAELLVFSYLEGGGSALDRFTQAGEYAGTLVEFGVGTGAQELMGPAGIAVAPDGGYFIPDAERHQIVGLDRSGRIVARLGKQGDGEGELFGPRDVDVGERGELVIADTDNHRVQVWRPNGTVVASYGGANADDEEGDASGAEPGRFFRPLGATFDADSAILVADTNNHRIQRITSNGEVTTFGRRGEEVGSLWFPLDVRVDAHGSILVADKSGARLQWFSRAGELSRVLTLDDMMPDGTAVADVDVDEAGNVFIPIGPLSKVVRGIARDE